MNKLTAIKIKYSDGTYSDEIPVAALAENVEWDNSHSLVDILGEVAFDTKGTIQDQITQISNSKVDSTDLNNYVNSTMKTEITNWLSSYISPATGTISYDASLSIEGAAADAKAAGQIVQISTTKPTKENNRIWVGAAEEQYEVLTTDDIDVNELVDIRVGADGKTYPSAGDSVRGQVGDLEDSINAVGNIISLIDDGKTTFNYTLFERGTYYTSSEPTYKYMVRTKTAISFDRKIVATANTGYKLKKLDNPRVHDTGWVNSVTLNANTEYFISIKQDPADFTITANIAEFVSNVTFETYDRLMINNLSESVENIESNEEKETVQWNDTYHANGRFIKCYNPYKEQKSLSLLGQLHCHTRNMSNGLYYDGTSTAETTLAKYKSLGYDFLTITDYGNTPGGITKPSESDIPSGLTWLFNSQEVRIDTLSGSDNPAVHICTYNSKTPITGLRGVSVQEYIDEYKKDGLMMSLAHPFSPGLNVTFADLDKIKTRLRFVEVFNGLSAAQDSQGTYPYAIPTGYGTDFAWQRLLDNGNAVWGVAVSDAHTIDVDWRMQFGCVYVFANNNNKDEIIKSLCCGNFVASEYLGSTIVQPSFENGVYSLDTGDDNATTVFYKENSEVVKTVTGRVATYNMTGNEKYIRAIVTKGTISRKTWTQPVINVFDEDYDNYSEFIKA